MHWESYPHNKIKEIVFEALQTNSNFRTGHILGLPASHLDSEVFYDDAPFLKDAPFLSTLIANPNHIGCHSITQSEIAFKGTQDIERDLIKMCGEEIFNADPDGCDGYVASGGTEANIAAIWMLRNFFRREKNALNAEIAIIYSEDSHYSMPKAGDVLDLHSIVMPVDFETRRLKKEAFYSKVEEAKTDGIKHFIVIMNMSTTMFGSVDDIEETTIWLDDLAVDYHIHVDGAFGGFIYPFSSDSPEYSFNNPRIISFSLDGHKMLQSPYGTGVFLTRKNFMHNICTEEAKYVKGNDYTLVGSRSGANAVAVWMIMRTYGSEGWKAKIKQLLLKTDRLCSYLDERDIHYFRNPKMNIVTIKASDIPETLAEKYMLVPDAHEGTTKWWKIVVMEHVKQGILDNFLMELDVHLAE